MKDKGLRMQRYGKSALSAFFALLNQINDVHVSSLLLHPELVIRDSCAQVSEK